MGKKPLVKAGGRSARPGLATGPSRGKVKKKVNSKPRDLDFQAIPFKLREIMKSRMEMNKPKKKKKQKKLVQKQGAQNQELQTDIPVPKFKRKKWESEYAYLTRMNQETQHVLFLSKNQPDRLPEMELDEKGELPKEDEATKKQKSEKKKEFDRRRLDKFIKKREEKKVMHLEEEMFKDRVAFGEVAMEPPTLTVKPKKSAAAAKAGAKQLFLKKLLDEGSGASNPPAVSMARKRMVEEERERVIKAYRDLKRRKMEQSTEAKPPKPRRT